LDYVEMANDDDGNKAIEAFTKVGKMLNVIN